MSEKSNVSAKSLLISIFKYSIATWINFLIYGVSLLLVARFVSAEVYGPVDIFISTSTLFMNICILGLDQSFIRFFNEPPEPLDKNNLFSSCFGIASLVLAVTCAICMLTFPRKILGLFFTDPLNNVYLGLLFLNAFMSMIGRFINILYRMDGNIKLYTLESVAMQFFSKLFYLVAIPFGATFGNLVLWEIIGMAVFSLAFLIPNMGRISLSPKVLFSKANRHTLPYGLALAPTAIMLYLNSLFSKVYIAKTIGNGPAGVFSMVSLLSNVVALIQAGFATFWSAFIYANYRTEQEKIKAVHDYLTFLIVEFLCLIIAFEDIIFFILGGEYASGIRVFPIMLLVPVFSIIQETTVYGISIAKKPIFDTIGIAISVVGNILLCLYLAPRFNIYGVCIALAGANFLMFLFRTIIGQKLYVSMISPLRTSIAIIIMFAIVASGCLFSGNFLLKLLCSAAGMVAYLILYRKQLSSAVVFAKDMLADIRAKRQ
jgi:O-antigen/teichoic acid export membrane protein